MQPGTDYTYAEGVLTILTDKALTVSLANNLQNPAVDDKTATTDRIIVSAVTMDDWYRAANLTLDGVNIDASNSAGAAALLVSSGELNLTLAKDSVSSLKSGFNRAGLMNSTNPLTITGEGSLTAQGGENSAGIGGGGGNGWNITINGGEIKAIGGASGAGIGGGASGSQATSGSHIKIAGGTVEAVAGSNGAGIGGGNAGSGSDIKITGGTVIATGDSNCAGIGGGYGGSGSDNSISGGYITVTNTSNQLQGFAEGSITGGAFADQPLSDDATRDTVYGIDLDDSHIAAANTAQGEDAYPVRVYEMKDPTYDSNNYGENSKIVTYNGSAHVIEPSELEPKRGDDPAEDAYVEYALNGTDDWTDEAPVDAGWYNVRLTVPQAISDGIWWREKTFAIAAGSAPALHIDPAAASYTAPLDLALSATAGNTLESIECDFSKLGSPTYAGADGTVAVPGSWAWADADQVLTTDTKTVEAVFTLGETVDAGNFTWADVDGWNAEANTLTVEVPVTVTEPTPDPDPVVPPSRPTYPPTVPDADGGDVDVSHSHPHRGDNVTVAPKPDEGQEVRDVVVTDSEGDKLEVTANPDGTFTFEQPAGEVTITVTFGCDGGTLCPSHDIPDVDQETWYHDAVDWAVTTGAITGYADGSFGPANLLTRGQMATVLWRIAGEPASETPLPGDCDPSAFYADAVSWALEAGVFSGFGDGSFGPAGAITREQAACVLHNRALAAGEDVSSSADLSAYPDADDVSAFAEEAMRWAVAEGVISGKEPRPGVKLLDPQGALTRAEAAAVLMRLEAAE